MPPVTYDLIPECEPHEQDGREMPSAIRITWSRRRWKLEGLGKREPESNARLLWGSDGVQRQDGQPLRQLIQVGSMSNNDATIFFGIRGKENEDNQHHFASQWVREG